MKPDEENVEKRMTLGEHLDELRRRLLYSLAGLVIGMTVGLVFGKQVIHYLTGPYLKVMGDATKLTVLSVGGGFSMYLKVSLYTGLVLSSCWIFYQLWMFVAAGLYPNEKRPVLMAVPFSFLLFILGAVFFMTVVSNPALLFFKEINEWLDLTPMVTLEEYINFVLQMVLIMGLSFQTPLVVLVLAKVGLVNMKRLNTYRRHVIAGITVFAGVFAPADPFSMLIMGAAMWALYELGVVLAWILVFRKRAREAE